MTYPAFELLEILVATAETSSLVEAAKVMGISQPAISVKLKQLQSSVPLPLFDFQGKRKALTHYGRELYLIAKIQREGLGREFERLNRSYARADRLTLRVGGRREIIERALPLLKFPGRIEFELLASEQATQALLRQEIDVSLSFARPDSSELIAKKLFDSGCLLSIHKRWLGGRKLTEALARSPHFLTETPCILYDRRGHLLRDWTDYLGVEFSNLKVRAIAKDGTLVQRLVDRGLGYSVLPDHLTTISPEVFTLPIPVKAVPRYTFYAIYHRSLTQIPAFRGILSHD